MPPSVPDLFWEILPDIKDREFVGPRIRRPQAVDEIHAELRWWRRLSKTSKCSVGEMPSMPDLKIVHNGETIWADVKCNDQETRAHRARHVANKANAHIENIDATLLLVSYCSILIELEVGRLSTGAFRTMSFPPLRHFGRRFILGEFVLSYARGPRCTRSDDGRWSCGIQRPEERRSSQTPFGSLSSRASSYLAGVDRDRSEPGVVPAFQGR